ncbi:hypothetical protein [Halorussus ruber]|uniref:hypothetical protein n=1 Tax=Halorussus ruber TaxID=1126238 RepID=UPI001B2FEAF6|nr:hypothetical protein [Halorussus ruber]
MPWDSPTVRVVFAATALAPLGVPLVSPALPVVRDAFVSWNTSFFAYLLGLPVAAFAWVALGEERLDAGTANSDAANPDAANPDAANADVANADARTASRGTAYLREAARTLARGPRWSPT